MSSGQSIDEARRLQLPQEDIREIVACFDQAERYLSSMRWCGGIVETRLLGAWPPGFCVFLCEIVPLEDADPALWVIVGDVPPLYLDTERLRSVEAALETYAAYLEDWNDAMRKPELLDVLPPLLASDSFAPLSADPELEELLSGRARFIRQFVLPNLDLEQRSTVTLK